jgi:hypothetical protein
MVSTNDTVRKVLEMEAAQEPGKEDFEAALVPELGRLEIPIRDRYAFGDIADELTKLASRLTALRHDSRIDTLTACHSAYVAIKMTNHFVKKARLAGRLGTKSGGSS